MKELFKFPSSIFSTIVRRNFFSHWKYSLCVDVDDAMVSLKMLCWRCGVVENVVLALCCWSTVVYVVLFAKGCLRKLANASLFILRDECYKSIFMTYDL